MSLNACIQTQSPVFSPTCLRPAARRRTIDRACRRVMDREGRAASMNTGLSLSYLDSSIIHVSTSVVGRVILSVVGKGIFALPASSARVSADHAVPIPQSGSCTGWRKHYEGDVSVTSGWYVEMRWCSDSLRRLSVQNSDRQIIFPQSTKHARGIVHQTS